MHRRITRWARNVFGFSRTEANAYLVLIAILILIHFFLVHFQFTTVSHQPQYLDSLVRALTITADTAAPVQSAYRRFDPNQVSFDSLMAMGVPRFLASNLVKYRDAGGRFKNSKDLRKLYGLTDSLWLVIEPWVHFENPFAVSTAEEGPSMHHLSNQEAEKWDLNQVDSLWLISIKGIGPVLSRRIVKYRELLGGFHSKAQLAEVYHLQEEVIEILADKVFINLEETPLNKLRLNHMDYLQIASHPYLSFNQARAIISYRNQHGLFNDLEDLKKIHLIDDSTYLRVHPYLDF